MKPRATYQPQEGDWFQVLTRSIVGTTARWEILCRLDKERFSSLAKAIHHGYTLFDRGDDFNVIAVHRGSTASSRPNLRALLWMDEVIPEPRETLREIAQQVGLDA